MPKPTKQRKEMKLVIKLGVASLATAVLLAGCAHRESASLPTRWGTVENPSGICKVTWTNQAWHMELPGGIFDLSPYQRPDNLAPRVLQSVAGDFVAEVKVTGDFDPGTLPVMPGRAVFFGAGLLLWESPTNYVRLERNEWTYGPARRQRHGPLFEHWAENRNRINNATLNTPFFQGDSTWLQLQRSNDVVTASYRHAGEEWQVYKQATVPLGEIVQVGVVAVSTSVKPFAVTFTDFQVRPVKPE
jgi:hypothetical protein